MLSNSGKPFCRHLIDAITLRLRRPPIGLGEYLDYGIWRRAITPQLRDEFIGWRQSAALDKSLNLDPSRVLANNKLISYLILQKQGLPIPEPVATFTVNGQRIGQEIVLESIDSVREFLQQNVYPFYVKPISAGYGRDVLGVTARDGQQLDLMDGNSISIDDFLRPFEFAPYDGMLLQRPLKAHSAIAELTGTEAISCVRFICFVTPSGPVVHTAFWKVTVGNNMLDNFSHGHYGNCLASVDIELGTVTGAIAKMSPLEEIERHPGTNRRLIGFSLPDWGKALELVYSASVNFPGLRLQNWDVAFCSDGPVIVELNTESELAVPQAISGRGLMDKRLRKILDEISAGDELIKAAVLSRQAK
jgi:putative polysaccharide biosynthesis protein